MLVGCNIERGNINFELKNLDLEIWLNYAISVDLNLNKNYEVVKSFILCVSKILTKINSFKNNKHDIEKCLDIFLRSLSSLLSFILQFIL